MGSDDAMFEELCSSEYVHRDRTICTKSNVLSNPNILGDCSIGDYQPFVEFDMERR
jgi:hypothetical protein